MKTFMVVLGYSGAALCAFLVAFAPTESELYYNLFWGVLLFGLATYTALTD